MPRGGVPHRVAVEKSRPRYVPDQQDSQKGFQDVLRGRDAGTCGRPSWDLQVSPFASIPPAEVVPIGVGVPARNVFVRSRETKPRILDTGKIVVSHIRSQLPNC